MSITLGSCIHRGIHLRSKAMVERVMVERVIPTLHCQGVEMRVDFLVTRFQWVKWELV